MRTDKHLALKLRLQGKSYNEIKQVLGIPKATLSDWFATLELSDKAKSRINRKTRIGSIRSLIKRNKLQTHLAQQRARVIRNSKKKKLAKLIKGSF